MGDSSVGRLPPLKRCRQCGLPETHESIVFDEDGVCVICRQHEFKQTQIDWKARERLLRELIDEYRGKYAYDCIIPFSGGKDSTFTAYKLVRDYGVKPLVVTFDHGFMRPTVLANTERTIKTLGVDYLKFRVNWHVVQRLMRESLRRKGDFCWHCHAGVFSFPMQIAVKFQVPLIFWGEPSSEYTSYYGYDQPEEVDERRYNRFINLGITAQDMVGFLDGTVTARELMPFTYPHLKDLRALGCRSVCLGSFIPWNTMKQSEIIERELGWQEEVVEGIPPAYGYEKIECAMQGVRDYLKFMKRGYGRTAHLAALDVRNQRKTPEEGLAMQAQYDGQRPASLDVFLEFVGMNEKEFNETALQHQISPHQHDPAAVRRGQPLWDQRLWDRSGLVLGIDGAIRPEAPIATGDRLFLRVLRTADVGDRYLAWMRDPIVTRFLESRFTTWTKERLTTYVRSMENDPDNVLLAIVTNDGRHIGNVKLGPVDRAHGTADLGILIGEASEWGRGFATEAIDLAVGYAFEVLDLRKVTAGCYATNGAAMAAFRKADFAEEGVRKGQYRSDRGLVDLVLLGRLRAEPPTPTGTRTTRASAPAS